MTDGWRDVTSNEGDLAVLRRLPVNLTIIMMAIIITTSSHFRVPYRVFGCEVTLWIITTGSRQAMPFYGGVWTPHKIWPEIESAKIITSNYKLEKESLGYELISTS